MTNEEKFKTAEKRFAAFMEYCDRHRKKFNGCTIGNCPLRTTSTRACQFLWLSLEAEEEKPISCPHCGGDAVLVKTQQGGANDTNPDSSIFTEHGAFVKCLGCGCKTKVVWKDCNTPNYIETAIAIWNRRVK